MFDTCFITWLKLYHICWFSFDFIFLQEGQGFFFCFFRTFKSLWPHPCIFSGCFNSRGNRVLSLRCRVAVLNSWIFSVSFTFIISYPQKKWMKAVFSVVILQFPSCPCASVVCGEVFCVFIWAISILQGSKGLWLSNEPQHWAVTSSCQISVHTNLNEQAPCSAER